MGYDLKMRVWRGDSSGGELGDYTVAFEEGEVVSGRVVRIDVERVVLVVWVVGAALAGLGGIMLGLTQQVSYLMGQQTLLLVFAAVTLGGLGTAFGALVGSLVVGLFVQLSTLFIAPELKNVGALVVLIVVLIIRPQGILGRRSRVG